jgi:cytochrome c-type biogenesis protein
VILGIASARDTVGEGAFMLGVYSLGLGVPFILAAFFAGPFMRFLSRFRRHLGSVEKLMGGLLVLTGILFLTGGMQTFAFYLLETFPVLQTFG